jgi:flagellar motor protein MotB
VVMAVALGSSMGCQYDTLRMENDALWSQNKELQDELARERLALETARSEQTKVVATRDDGRVDILSAAANTGGFNAIKGVETITSNDQVTVRVPGDVLFSAGKANLRSSARKTLSQIASVLKSDYPNHTVLIKGYTDADPIKKSKWADNLELSLQRAAAVHRYLDKQGVEPRSMEAVGQGQWHPRKTKKLSRRVEIIVARRP